MFSSSISPRRLDIASYRDVDEAVRLGGLRASASPALSRSWGTEAEVDISVISWWKSEKMRRGSRRLRMISIKKIVTEHGKDRGERRDATSPSHTHLGIILPRLNSRRGTTWVRGACMARWVLARQIEDASPDATCETALRAPPLPPGMPPPGTR